LLKSNRIGKSKQFNPGGQSCHSLVQLHAVSELEGVGQPTSSSSLTERQAGEGAGDGGDGHRSGRLVNVQPCQAEKRRNLLRYHTALLHAAALGRVAVIAPPEAIEGLRDSPAKHKPSKTI